MEPNEQIMTWLRDAHAMEQSMEQVLTRHVDAARENPALHERLDQHLIETRRHAQLVRHCLERLGDKPSMIKSIAGGFMGAMQGMSTGVFQDEIVKNALADYAMEHFEIGCYSSLIAAADDAGLDEIRQTCGEILREETAMATWFEEQIPGLTRLYLHQQSTA
jgi:ferritin-like metal-binding protein YciE